jgi:hypothetical protein
VVVLDEGEGVGEGEGVAVLEGNGVGRGLETKLGLGLGEAPDVGLERTSHEQVRVKIMAETMTEFDVVFTAPPSWRVNTQRINAKRDLHLFRQRNPGAIFF